MHWLWFSRLWQLLYMFGINPPHSRCGCFYTKCVHDKHTWVWFPQPWASQGVDFEFYQCSVSFLNAERARSVLTSKRLLRVEVTPQSGATGVQTVHHTKWEQIVHRSKCVTREKRVNRRENKCLKRENREKIGNRRENRADREQKRVNRWEKIVGRREKIVNRRENPIFPRI